MAAFLGRRLLAGAATILVASFVLFAVMHLLPGDEVKALFPGTRIRVPPELYAAVEAEMGLDRPFIVQWAVFVGDLVSLDFGRMLPSVTPDYRRVIPGDPIRPVLVARLLVSGGILAGVLALNVLIAPLLAWVAARRPASLPDRVSNAAAIALVAVPALVAAILVQTTFAYWTDLSPTPRWSRHVAWWQNWIPPVLGLGLGTAAHVALVAREEVLVALSQPWARVQRGLGLPRGRIIRHAWRPAAGGTATALGAHVAAISTGLIVVEDVFGVPGIGTGLLLAIRSQDRTLLVTMLVVVVALAVLASTLADVARAAFDPRQRA